MEPALIQKLSREVFDPDSIYFQYVLPERQRRGACLNEAYRHTLDKCTIDTEFLLLLCVFNRGLVAANREKLDLGQGFGDTIGWLERVVESFKSRGRKGRKGRERELILWNSRGGKPLKGDSLLIFSNRCLVIFFIFILIEKIKAKVAL